MIISGAHHPGAALIRAGQPYVLTDTVELAVPSRLTLVTAVEEISSTTTEEMAEMDDEELAGALRALDAAHEARKQWHSLPRFQQQECILARHVAPEYEDVWSVAEAWQKAVADARGLRLTPYRFESSNEREALRSVIVDALDLSSFSSDYLLDEEVEHYEHMLSLNWINHDELSLLGRVGDGDGGTLEMLAVLAEAMTDGDRENTEAEVATLALVARRLRQLAREVH